MINTDECIIRKYREGDEKEINDLFNEVFDDRRSLEEWRWKFKENPLQDTNFITVAEFRGKIVGQYANLPALFKYQDKVFKVVFPVDNFVHKDFRGGMKGIQGKMHEDQCEVVRNKNICLGLGFPNRDAYVIGKRVLKYKDIGQIPVLFKRLNLRLAAKRRLSWFPGFVLRLIQASSSIGYRLSLGMKNRNPIKGLKIKVIDSFDERFDILWAKVKKQHEIIGVRDRRYLNWRYKKPGKNYEIIVAEKDNEILGHIVTSTKNTEGASEGYIVDMLSTGDERVDSTLINKALFVLASKNVDFVLCWMLPDNKIYDRLKENGFVRRDVFTPVNAVYCIFDPSAVDESFIKDIRNWYLTMADSDVF